MGRMRASKVIAGAMAGMLLLGACAGGGDSGVETAAEPMRAEGGGQGAAEVAEERAAVGDAADGAAVGGEDRVAGLTGAGSQISESVLRKRIRRAEIDLVVEDGGEAFADIRALARRSGGYVDSVDLTESEDREGRRGTIVIRVPADGLDDVLTELAALAIEEPATRISTEDVTEEFIDLEARLKNLRVLEAELQELLAEVRESGDPDPNQLFTVFERLRQVRDEIEQIEGRRRLLEDQVALSKVTIHMEERTPAAAVPEDPWRPGEVATEATSALLSSARAIANVAIWVGIVVVPVALAVALPVVAVVALRRRWGRGEPTPTA